MLKKKKIKLISLLASAFVALAGFAIGFNQITTKASAQPTGSVFEMEDGASLKISEEGGLRFRVKMDEAQANYITENEHVTLHFLVAPHEFYNAVPQVDGIRDYYNGLKKKLFINVDEAKIYEEDGYYWANGCVTNIHKNNRYLDYTLLAYTLDTSTGVMDYANVNLEGESVESTSTNYNLKNVRGSLVDVLSQAVVGDYTKEVLDCTAYKGWFGTEDYPIQVNNLATYNNLVNKVNSGEDFSDYTINVSDTVPEAGRVEVSEGKTLETTTSYIVKFCNDDDTLYKKYIVVNGESVTAPNAPAKAADAQYEYTFLGWDANGDGNVDEVQANVQESVTYKAVYSKTVRTYTVTLDAQGGVADIPASVKVAYGTSLSEFYKQKYIPADSGFLFDSWKHNGEKIDPNDTVTGDMTLTAYYKRVDGVAVEESPVNGNFYQAFLALPTDVAVGTPVLVEMEVFITGKIVSHGVDSSSEYYNEYTTSSIKWVDTVWTTDGGEVNGAPEVLSFDQMQSHAGEWMKISFVATVRNYSVLKTGTGWAGVEFEEGNAVYLFASQFKSAASFNYRNVTMTTEGVMPAGVQKTNPDKYYQSVVGLPTDLAAGTFVSVEMDVRVTGLYDSPTIIEWVDTVWTTAGGERNAAPVLVNSTMMAENAGDWIHLAFYATVRDFDVLRTDGSYPTMDVSSTGTGVFLLAENFLSSSTFAYKNVVISADEADVGTAMPAGTQKTSNANGYYQSVVGLPTDFAAGTPVWVEMDVYITGAYDQYTTGIRWVDTVHGNGTANTATTVLDYATISANVGKWIHVSFPATVRDFDTLRMYDVYETVDVSSYGNAVFLLGANFKSAASFNYKDVSIVGRAVDGGYKTGTSSGYRQAFAGLSTNLPVGTSVTVDMDVYITGTHDQHTYISWLDTVWTTAGGEVNKETKLITHDDMNANVGKWIHVSFPATVRDFDVLRLNPAYTATDVSFFGNAVFLVAYSFTSADTFIYKNVEMTAEIKMPAGQEKTNPQNAATRVLRQSFVGLSTDYAVGTTVTVGMDVYITGASSQGNASIKWVDTVWTTAGGEVNATSTILTWAEMSANAGQWIHVEFEATVRNFSVLRIGTEYATMDVSSYGNAIYVMAANFTSADSFTFKNVKISLPGENEPEVPDEPVMEGTAMPDGTQKTSNANGYYQAVGALPTDFAAGTPVWVEMDVYVTGTYDQYSTGLIWVDSIGSDGSTIASATTIVGVDLMNANAGQWIHVSFLATVRDFDSLRVSYEYAAVDVSSYGPAVYLAAKAFKSTASVTYKNVFITAAEEVVGEAMPTGTKPSSQSYYQSFVSFPTDLAAGTFVSVEMEVYVTGTADSYTSIGWVNTVWGDNAVNAAPTVVSYDTMTANKGQWIRVRFDAYVRDFSVLKMSGYPEFVGCEYGTAVYIFAKNFKSTNSFRYRNVTITAHKVTPDGTANKAKYYQAVAALPVNVPEGTTVTVSMDILVTGKFVSKNVDSSSTYYDQWATSSITWVDTVYGDGGAETAPVILTFEQMQSGAGQWIHVEFEATVRNFAALRYDGGYPAIDTSSYGNAVYLFVKNFKSAASFVYNNVEIVANGELVYPEGVSNGEDITSYSIVISDDASKSTQYAATILQARLRQALGVDITVTTDATAEGEFEIILGETNRNECADINYNDLGEEGFLIKNVGKDLVIAGNDRGSLYGVYAYLEYLGYRFYTPEVEKIPTADEIFVPAHIDLSWMPTFEYREVMFYSTWDAEWAVTQRINSDFMRSNLKVDSKYGGFVGYVGGSSMMVHTFSKLLPEELRDTHPEYFANRKVTNSDGHYNQPCLTNEGAYQTILSNALAAIAADRKANIISISENDGGDYCTCATCNDEYAEYGLSGTFFRFINRIAGDIAKVYPDVYVDTLSYDMSEEVPAFELADNVIVRVCPKMCNHCTDPATCAQLAADQTRVEGFTAICDNVYVWFYPVNHGNYYVATPNYEEMRYQVNFFAQKGVKGIYAEGYHRENAEFGELKAYLLAKLMQNPYMTEEEYNYHYNDFLEGYYGGAAKYIAQYHTLTKENMNKVGHDKLHAKDYYYPEDNFDFTDMSFVNEVNALWASALASVTEGSEEWHHVKKSMIHWTYLELYNTMDSRYKNGTSAEKAELVARNEALYNDIKYYGVIQAFSNSHELITVTNFTKSPNKNSGDWFNEVWTLEEILGGLGG